MRPIRVSGGWRNLDKKRRGTQPGDRGNFSLEYWLCYVKQLLDTVSGIRAHGDWRTGQQHHAKRLAVSPLGHSGITVPAQTTIRTCSDTQSVSAQIASHDLPARAPMQRKQSARQNTTIPVNIMSKRRGAVNKEPEAL